MAQNRASLRTLYQESALPRHDAVLCTCTHMEFTLPHSALKTEAQPEALQTNGCRNLGQ